MYLNIISWVEEPYHVLRFGQTAKSSARRKASQNLPEPGFRTVRKPPSRMCAALAARVRECWPFHKTNDTYKFIKKASLN